MTHKIENLDSLNAAFETQKPLEIVRWAVKEFAPKIAMTSSFGPESGTLLHVVSQVNPEVPVLFLETGYHFPETLEYRDRLIKLFGLKNVINLKADPARMDVLPMSPFGLIELVRQRTGRAIAEVLNAGQGEASTETLALAALRRLEREAVANRASQLTLRTSPETALCLEADAMGWRAAMTDRIGPRFALESRQDVSCDFVEVVASK